MFGTTFRHQPFQHFELLLPLIGLPRNDVAGPCEPNRLESVDTFLRHLPLSAFLTLEFDPFPQRTVRLVLGDFTMSVFFLEQFQFLVLLIPLPGVRWFSRRPRHAGGGSSSSSSSKDTCVDLDGEGERVKQRTDRMQENK